MALYPATDSTTLLGSLTTTWTPPPECTINIQAGGDPRAFSSGWRAQNCVSGPVVQDQPTCWPPRAAGVATPTQPLLAWGLYSPGLVCPDSYETACSYDGGAGTGDFDFTFSPRASETAVGCCPLGYACTTYGLGQQTCAVNLSSTVVPKATCESGATASLTTQTIPFAMLDTEADSTVTIDTFTAYAPLFQLVYQSSDISPPTSSLGAASVASTGDISGSMSPQPSASEPQRQSRSTGAQAGIGVGVALGVVLLAAISFCALRVRRRHRSALAELHGHPVAAGTAGAVNTKPPVELQAPVAELAGRDVMPVGSPSGGGHRTIPEQTVDR
ncbi:hypothetical protein F4780DRAFT_777242 [Xylariomycetidae sp. FL0641]|nr:hypothetical protein F4780DRAFT_777242 [Xylariomycetidae sp. FL0641]